MVLVVNETGEAPHHVSVANQDFAAALHSRFKVCWQSADDSGLTLFRDSASSRDVLLVDRFSDGHRFTVKGGVGQARKTGADLAAHLIHKQRLRSPWIHCTDADVHLPQRYFTCIESLSDGSAKDTAALVYPFKHRLFPGTLGDEKPNIHQAKIMQVTQLYEYSLRYYVAGLSFARSPYAFHTIGSTISVNAIHYARVRGFPRRQAGEDFYLLNKLAKVGTVRQLSSETECGPIEIAARLSDRVPFGTGAAVGKLMEMEDPARDFLLYHPSVFALLRVWLESLPDFWQSRSSDIAAVLSREQVSGPADGFSKPSQKELQALVDGLEEIGAASALQHAFRQSSDSKQFKRQMHTWFDAFRTLKLIHYLRDHQLPSISFEELLSGKKMAHLLKYERLLPALSKALQSNFLDVR